MKTLYYVHTGNRFGQILLFTTKAKAKRWLKSATRYTDAEIEQEIHATSSTGYEDFASLYSQEATQ